MWGEWIGSGGPRSDSGKRDLGRPVIGRSPEYWCCGLSSMGHCTCSASISMSALAMHCHGLQPTVARDSVACLERTASRERRPPATGTGHPPVDRQPSSRDHIVDVNKHQASMFRWSLYSSNSMAGRTPFDGHMISGLLRPHETGRSILNAGSSMQSTFAASPARTSSIRKLRRLCRSWRAPSTTPDSTPGPGTGFVSEQSP